MTRTKALKLLIEKCPEIVGPMLSTPFFFDALEARMGRWLRERDCTIKGSDETQITYVKSDEHSMGTVWLRGISANPDSFTAHAIAVIELAAKEVQGE